MIQWVKNFLRKKEKITDSFVFELVKKQKTIRQPSSLDEKVYKRIVEIFQLFPFSQWQRIGKYYWHPKIKDFRFTLDESISPIQNFELPDSYTKKVRDFLKQQYLISKNRKDRLRKNKFIKREN